MPKLLSPATALAATIFASPLVAGQASIYLPDPGFAPEGISASADGTLYLGSITQGRLISLSADATFLSDIAPAGTNGMVSIIGTHVSADDAFVFACSSDPGASALTGTAAPALLQFDRETGTPAGRFELPEGGVFCNDIAELPDGTILATDSFVPRIYALRPGARQLEIWFEDPELSAEGFNFNGIAYQDGAVYFLRYSSGTLHKVTVDAAGAAAPAQNIALPRPVAGADGLTSLGDGRFLIVEGGGLSAGSRGALLGVKLSEDGLSGSLETLAADLNVPTTADVVGAQAFVVEGQLDHLFDAENAGPADPYRIRAVPLPESYQ